LGIYLKFLEKPLGIYLGVGLNWVFHLLEPTYWQLLELFRVPLGNFFNKVGTLGYSLVFSLKFSIQHSGPYFNPFGKFLDFSLLFPCKLKTGSIGQPFYFIPLFLSSNSGLANGLTGGTGKLDQDSLEVFRFIKLI